MKDLIQKYKHGWILSYFFIYIAWFFLLEKKVTTNYAPVHIWLDDYIPFNEWFVIPYYLWFLFIFATVAYFFLTSKEDFYKVTAFLFIGMTVCLIIYTIWPNGQNLRPDLSTIGRDNIFIRIVKALYATDTSTNVCPSIHVFNSIGANIAIHRSEKLKNYKLLRIGATILTVLISLSTMFLKQHSAFDAITAIALSIVMYYFVYGWSDSKQAAKAKEKKVYAQY
ncbi:phosphatase PAP2 family protein [Anaerocolumna sedimenticola]|uniref:Phosphatase PAP2 family protein n=1 Tax=Anaerocolumna sedimenticola TaxID=2696063 RepID=A0A6P1TID9_9FIRM|nr:phosphatase PAP2 family protein [Anaerocolumna sedimenticola]QHQ60067.1 phosphatase PAP2 family protein [Anaerocolumna sedimenticola]